MKCGAKFGAQNRAVLCVSTSPNWEPLTQPPTAKIAPQALHPRPKPSRHSDGVTALLGGAASDDSMTALGLPRERGVERAQKHAGHRCPRSATWIRGRCLPTRALSTSACVLLFVQMVSASASVGFVFISNCIINIVSIIIIISFVLYYYYYCYSY